MSSEQKKRTRDDDGDEAAPHVKRARIGDVDNFMSLLTCPVCAEVMKSGQAFQCASGHALCKTCRKKVAVCPTCRCEMPERPIVASVVNTLLDICELPCPNAARGCTAVMLSRCHNTHLLECKHAAPKCLRAACGQAVPTDKYLDHLDQCFVAADQPGIIRKGEIKLGKDAEHHMVDVEIPKDHKFCCRVVSFVAGGCTFFLWVTLTTSNMYIGRVVGLDTPSAMAKFRVWVAMGAPDADHRTVTKTIPASVRDNLNTLDVAVARQDVSKVFTAGCSTVPVYVSICYHNLLSLHVTHMIHDGRGSGSASGWLLGATGGRLPCRRK